MQATITTEIKQYFHCPECGAQHQSHYNHLFPGEDFGPWYCEECGCGVRGTLTAAGLIFTHCNECITKTLVLLRLDAQLHKAVYIVVPGKIFHQKGDDLAQLPLDQQGKDTFYYNYKISPSEYLQVPVAQDGDTDPVGLFVHQETVLMPEGYRGALERVVEGGCVADTQAWRQLFASLR